MGSRNITAVLLGLLLLAVGVPVWGQAWAGKGRLQGQVRDESGKPIQGAKVVLRKDVTDRVVESTDGPKAILTDKNGRWSILGLAGGEWGVLIEKEGYMVSEGRLKVNEFGPAQPVNVTLKVIPKEVIEQAEKQSETGQAKAALEQGNALLQQQKYAEARAAYEAGMAKLPDSSLHPAILRAIADTYHKEGNTDQAVAALKKALALAPQDPVTLQLMVNLLAAAGREAEAKTYMEQLPQGTTVDPAVLLNLGIKAFNEGKMDQAFAEFDRVVKENPQLPDAYYYRGLVYLNQGKNAEAKADFQKLVELDPNHANAAEAREFLKDL
ncbi:MAG TPA: tetratricopeptide repeat protein [Thermoanaerobaculia bacterium]|nr:tetratricopeptide repeat protein [Thermoanaerobaculia bacterium]